MAERQQVEEVRITRPGIRSVKSHLILAGVSALLLMWSFPEPGLGWLAHIALVPVVLLAIRAATLKGLFWTTFLVAYCWWMVMIYWLTPVTQGGYVGLALFMALYLPVSLVVLRILHTRWRMPLFLAVPMAWVTLEWVRGITPAGGFGWYMLAHSQSPYLPEHGAGRLMQIADIFGEWGVSFLVAMTNGMICDLLSQPWVKVIDGKAKRNMVITASIGIWLVSMIAVFSYGTWRIGQTESATGDGATVAVVQTNVAQNNKDNPRAEQIMANWNEIAKLAIEASRLEPKPAIIVLPETMVPFALNPEAISYYSENDAAFFARFHGLCEELARECSADLLVGSHAYFDFVEVPIPGSDETYPMPGRAFNSAFRYQPNGKQSSTRYDKVHRVPFGEFIPWVDSLPWLKRMFIKYMTPYEVDYTLQAGDGLDVFGIPAGEQTIRAVTPICFEDTVARLARSMIYANGEKRADVMINLTNDGWFAGSRQPVHHFQAAVFRCVENRVPMVRSVNTGVSGFISSAGAVGPVIDRSVSDVAAAKIGLDRRITVFGRIGQAPVVIIAAITLVLTGISVVSARSRRRKEARNSIDSA